MFLWNLLTSESPSDSAAQNLSFWSKYGMLFFVGGLLVLFILYMAWSSRKRKKQQEETNEKLSRLGAGTKIETIGGVFGTIVEMNNKEGTFVLETGSDKFGKTYLRFDRNAIARIIEEVKAPEEPTDEENEESIEDVAPEFAPVAYKAETEETEEKKD